ncbi:hypothetical protein OU426_09035 [Frigidibacter sp. RF13]|uniref:hypothetical protein n=1 Tax=Frigidibacter sp. RF13 TaxID=2997340 RepID=UPI002270CE1A|nr:hypothetical protein [Frigidibacter sp. RF13]MCY1126998.1 hypothetical protein [Frigidibacter sp. RF13]
MRRFDWRGLTLLLLAVVLVMGGLPFLKGAFYIGKHEGDTLHLAEIVLRMAAGEWPHLDFMTPIGLFATAPIALFVKAGWGFGHAIFLAQLLVALVLLPTTVWVVSRRIEPLTGRAAAWAYGALVMALCLALVHGESEISISISMHYNRWAWAIAFLIVPLVVLDRVAEPTGWDRRLDGALIGAGVAALVMIKMTYAVALFPGLLIGLIARRWWVEVAFAVIAGLVVFGIVTLLAGPAFWLAYLRDLAIVSASDVRPMPGKDFGTIAAAPAYLGGTIALFALVIFLRQAGRDAAGVALLFLAPGFLYITYQNYGNDPQWLALTAVIGLGLRPAAGLVNGLGWDLRKGMGVAALALLCFGLPSALNLAYSPLRHLAQATAKTRPLLSRLPQHGDVLTEQGRIYKVSQTVAADGPGTPFALYLPLAGARDVAVLNGESLPECETGGGFAAWFETLARDLEGAGYAGKRIFIADLFAQLWMYGPFEPIKGAAPWYYGDLPGIENADYILVPECPLYEKARYGILKSLKEGGYVLTEERRTPLYRLMRLATQS